MEEISARRVVNEYVIDTNCVISALIRPSSSRNLLCSEHFLFHAPEHMLAEIERHQEEIREKAGITEEDFSLLRSVILACIHMCPERELRQYKEEALKLTEHKEDAPFIALCLAKNLPLWSNDKGFKKQSVIAVFSTAELLDDLKKRNT